MKKVSGYWSSKTNCRNVAKRCKSKSELYKRFPSAYSSSLKNGWIDEFFPQSSSKRGKIFWTKENCREEAKKYKTRREFWKCCQPGAKRALNLGIMDDLFPRMRFVHKVNKIAPDGTVLATFDSVAAAARDINAYGSSIEAICKHKPGKQTVHGFRYEYAD